MSPFSRESTSDTSQSQTSRSRLPGLSTTSKKVQSSGSSTPGPRPSRGYGGPAIRPESSNATESDTQRSYRDKSLHSETLLKPLRLALQTCKSNGDVQSFLPDDKLADIMTEENVQSYLSESGSIFHEQYNGILSHVCGQTGRTHVRRASRRIFAVLLLIEEPQLITDFMKEGIYDDDLPLSKVSEGGNYLARGPRDKSVMIDTFFHWTYAQRETFYTKQWQVQAPILRKGRRTTSCHPVHNFGKDVILPWIEHEEHYSGHSDVFRVKIHKAHCWWHVDDKESFALKTLKSVGPQYREHDFRLEVKALLKVKLRAHLEVGLVTSFEHRERFHLLFRWADGGNLRDLWTNNPHPNLNHSWICWVAQQLHGLAHGLDGIHNTKLTKSEVESIQTSPISPDFPQQPFSTVYNLAPEDDEGKDYGRHGDIKPENILWFKQDKSHPEFGILKLSDFGLTTFHRAWTTAVDVEEVRVTHTYSAPEREIEETLSRPFDVWSLGCIILEFVTWMLLGSKGLDAFEERRQRDGGGRNPKFSLDNFFTVFRSETEAQDQAKVKPSVDLWIKRLKRQPQCSRFLTELLEYIQSNMLLVQKDKRDTAMSVSDQLKVMLHKCKKDEKYALGREAPRLHDKEIFIESEIEDHEMVEPETQMRQAKRKYSDIQFDLENRQGPASRTRSRLR